MIDKLEQIIFYFEGTCEICLGNLGIEKYRQEIDDLIHRLDDFSDDIKLRILYASAIIEYKLDKYESAFENWQKALVYALGTDNKLYAGKIYSNLAIYYYITKNKPLELHYFKEAECIFKDSQYYGELAAHYINILWVKRYEKDTGEVLEYMDKALYYAQLSDSKKNARVYLHLGYIQKTIMNNFVQAIEHLIKSIEISRENEFIEMESMTLNILADGYDKIDKVSETINIYTSIIKDDRYRNITANLKSAVLCNLISCYIRIKDVDNAEKYLNELKKVMPDVQANIWESYYAVFLGLKAQLYCLQGINLETALKLVEESRQIYYRHKTGFILDDFEILTAQRFGDIYFKMGDIDQALHYYKAMMELTPEENMYYKKAANERLAEAYEAMGDDIAALSFYKECNANFNNIKEKRTQEQYETMYIHFMRSVKEKEINRLSKLKSVLEKDSNIDSLTNLYNRNYLNKYIEYRQYGAGTCGDLSLLMIDIDSFKKYNDNYGHEKGDAVLKIVARVLGESCIGITDKIVRYGGEEFLIILEDVPEQAAINLSEKIIHKMAVENIEHKYSEVERFITVSIGIASCMPGEFCNTIKVIEAADQALYLSKRNGKNRFTHAGNICEACEN